jgi:hypothetical protein
VDRASIDNGFKSGVKFDTSGVKFDRVESVIGVTIKPDWFSAVTQSLKSN